VNNEEAETSPPVGSTKADDGWQQAGPHLWAAMHIRAMIHLFFTTLLQTMNEGTAIGMLDMSRDDFWRNAEQQERESRLAKPLVAGRTGDDQGGLAHPDGTQHNIILWGHEFGKVVTGRQATDEHFIDEHNSALVAAGMAPFAVPKAGNASSIDWAAFTVTQARCVPFSHPPYTH
jgi:hypothetical protein